MPLFLRLILFILLVEAVFFIILRIYLRSLRHEALEGRWDHLHPDRTGDNPDRRTFVHCQMQGHGRSLGMRLSWLVFIVPLLVVGAVIYWVNGQ